jgi:hypothetical protein
MGAVPTARRPAALVAVLLGTLPATLLMGVGAPARAHIGASVAKANYTHPQDPWTVITTDGGAVSYDYSRYVPEESTDGKYLLQWTDGDVDPTGKFTFYYFDHDVSNAVTAAQVEMLGTIVHDTQGREARSIYVACYCDADAGVKCPDINDAGPTGARWCDNSVEWDTSGLPDGEYWLMAVNHDPPFYVYNPSNAPVWVHHGAPKPPLVIVTRPDGLGSADASYTAQFIIHGMGALTLDLSYGENQVDKVLGPTTSLVKALPVTAGADGLTTWQWSTSQLPNENFFLRATVKDAQGAVSYSDSRFPLAVYHTPLDDGGAPRDMALPAADLAAPVQPPRGSCAVAGRPDAAGALLVAAALAALLSRVGAKRLRRVEPAREVRNPLRVPR